MLPFRASHAIGLLLIAQGLCLSLPVVSESKSRIVRDTADIPTELFKPVGTNEGYHEARGNSTGASGGSDEPVRFLERSNGGVEVVTEENDEEEEDDYPAQPLSRQNPRRINGYPIPQPIYANAYQTDPRGVPRFSRPESSIISGQPLSSRSSFSGPNIRQPFNDNDFYNNGMSLLESSLQNSAIPNHIKRQFFSNGPSGGIGGSSNNFYRSESYSYKSDGRGPPRIEQNVFDSRDGLGGSSMRNF